jgi:hypothetical protein
MSMKTSTTPRRIYVRNGVTHICFEGRTFGPRDGESVINTEVQVTVTPVESDGGRARIKVSQRRGTRTFTEIWRSVKVPCTPRS